MSEMKYLSIQAGVDWWVMPYLRTLVFLCWMMGTTPDLAKVERTIMRGIRTRVVSKRTKS